MKNVFNSLAIWLKRKHREARLKRIISREKALIKEANDVIQVTEYNGTLYMCYNYRPIVPITAFKNNINETLVVLRQVYIDYNKDKDET